MPPKSKIIQGSLFEEDYLIRSVGSIARQADVALTELVANAWDAGAANVKIHIPENYKEPLTVEDDGTGMSEEEFVERWMTLGYNREKHQGVKVEFPPERSDWKRWAFGRNGVGRHALFCFGCEYQVETWKANVGWRFIVALSSGKDPFVLKRRESLTATGHGTRLIVEVEKNLPGADRIRDIVSARFIHDPHFQIFVNNRSIPLLEHPGFIQEEEIKVSDSISINIAVVDSSKAARTKLQQGIAFWVGGRLVGEPSWTLDSLTVIDGRTNFAKRYTFLVRSNDIFDELQPDWSGFKKSEKMKEVYEQVEKFVTKTYREISTTRIEETKERVYTEHLSEIRSLPASGQMDVSKFVEEVVAKNPTISSDTLDVAVQTVINLQQSKSGRELLVRLSKLSEDDVSGLNRLLSEWTVQDALTVLDEVDRRIAVVEAIKRLSQEKSTDELQTLHPLITDARWLFGPEFDSPEYASNLSLKNAVKQVFGKTIDEEKKLFINERKRPDLVILKDASLSCVGLESIDDTSGLATTREILIIEIKRGGLTIGRDEVHQADNYVQDLINSGFMEGRPYIKAFVVGHKIGPKVEAVKKLGEPEYGRLHATTFGQLTRTAEKRLFKLRELLESRYGISEAIPKSLRDLLSMPEQLPLLNGTKDLNGKSFVAAPLLSPS